MEEVVIVQPLPSTAETENSPIIQSAFDVVTVYYDHGRVNNFARWSHLKFLDGFAVRWTPYAARSLQMIDAYSAVVEIKNSKWLANTRTEAKDNRMPIGESVHHYVIYFDHFGCLEVLADSFEFVDEVEPPASIE